MSLRNVNKAVSGILKTEHKQNHLEITRVSAGIITTYLENFEALSSNATVFSRMNHLYSRKY